MMLKVTWMQEFYANDSDHGSQCCPLSSSVLCLITCVIRCLNTDNLVATFRDHAAICGLVRCRCGVLQESLQFSQVHTYLPA